MRRAAAATRERGINPAYTGDSTSSNSLQLLNQCIPLCETIQETESSIEGGTTAKTADKVPRVTQARGSSQISRKHTWRPHTSVRTGHG